MDGPPKFDPEEGNANDPLGAEDTGYQPAPPPPQGATTPRASAPKPPPVNPVPPPRSAEPLRARPPARDDDEEVVEISALPLLLGIGALLVALLALLVSIGIINIGKNSEMVNSDRIAAGAIGNTQISDGAVDIAKISQQTVSDLQGKEGPIGPAGEQGPRGPAGPGLRGLTLVSKEATGGLSASATASCSGSQIAISGGASVDAPSGNVALTASAPTSTEDGWIARASAVKSNPGSWKLTVYAWCANDPRP